MARWRPPPERSSPHITAEGHARLKDEFEALWRRRRPEVVKALAAAAAEGDRSENAEYQYRKKELREIDARLKYLTRRLQDVRVVDVIGQQRDAVYFGAWVELADVDDRHRRYRLVGADEVDTTKGWISIDAPLARALLGKRIGDWISVDLPGGRLECEVIAVDYAGN
ncbi:MAG: transcription elongation factor GreB [Nevskiales bacterium]|nr:transcription elongation factor GreB [Nevskiales bacterium]